MIIVEGWVRLDEGELDRLHDVAITMLEETRKKKAVSAIASAARWKIPI